MLLAREDIDVCLKNGVGMSALDFAATNYHDEVTYLILQRMCEAGTLPSPEALFFLMQIVGTQIKADAIEEKLERVERLRNIQEQLECFAKEVGFVVS